MTYRVEISRRAAKAVTGLDKPVRRKVPVAIGALAGDPRPVGCKKLACQETWRIRGGGLPESGTRSTIRSCW